MTLKKLIPAAIIAIAASTANAGGFDGPFVQLGIGGSSTSTKISGSDSPLDGSNSQGSVNGLLAAGYSQSIGSAGFNLAANIFYVIGNQNAGSPNGTMVDQFDGGVATSTGSSNSKLKGTFGISVEPGWNFTESTLGFVKLAWLNSRLNSSLNVTGSCTNNNGSPCSYENWNVSNTNTVNGFGYGLGVKQMVTNNIFVGVDLMGVTYGSASNIWAGDSGVSGKPSQFIGFASVGYKF